MKTLYKIICALIISLLALIFITPMASFVIFSHPEAQQKISAIASKELSKLFGASVSIGTVNITPFNRISLNNVSINDIYKKEAIKIGSIGVGIDYYEFFKNEKIVISHAELVELDANLYKHNDSAQINIQNIINAFKSKDKSKAPTKFDLRINTVVIRKSNIKYNNIDKPSLSNELFDKNHILITDLSADIQLPQLKNDDFIIDIKRLEANEKSGIAIKKLLGYFHIASNGININNLSLLFNDSQIKFDDISIPINNWKDLNEKFKNPPLNISITGDSYITLCDISPFLPNLKTIDDRFNLNIDLNGDINNIRINKLIVNHNSKPISVNAKGSLTNIKNPETAQISLPEFSLTANTNDIIQILRNSQILKNSTKIPKIGKITLNGEFNGNPFDAKFNCKLTSSIGNAKINMDYSKPKNSKHFSAKGNLIADNIKTNILTGNKKLGNFSGNVKFDLFRNSRNRSGNINGIIDHIEFNGYRYSNITTTVDIDDYIITGNANINDPNIAISINGNANIDTTIQSTNFIADIKKLNLHNLNISKKYLDLSANIEANLSGFDIDNSIGNINITDFSFSNNPKKELHIDHIHINAQNDSLNKHLSIASNFFNADIKGKYSFKTIAPTIKAILSQSFPIFFKNENSNNLSKQDLLFNRLNDFTYDITITKDKQLFDYFNIASELFEPIKINGSISYPQNRINLTAKIPYITQKNKLIEDSKLEIDIAPKLNKCMLKATSSFPTKHGTMPLELTCHNENNSINTNLEWVINRDKTFKGNINLSTHLSRNEDDSTYIADININPSHIIFNDSVWNINKAQIHYANKKIIVDGFDVRHGNQFITLSGKASSSPDDKLHLALNNVNLDFIFRTLEINKALIGGDATGSFYASQVFSKEPIAYTPELKVKNISYNSTILGDATITAHWNNELQAVSLDAIVNQESGDKSRIYGEIFPMKEALDIKFDATKINVGFMNPYMEAFASNIKGLASGKARLFGTFKHIDLEGDIYAQDLSMKINFTNTVYSASDSIKLRPGYIGIKNITLYDRDKNTALLNGWVKHKFFKEPEFDFSITNTRNFLCYNVAENIEQKWHGVIYGNKAIANINGKPGLVNIIVTDIETAPKTDFTFTLSDMEKAYEYSFLTFKDSNPKPIIDKTNITEPTEVTAFKNRVKKNEESSSSVYNMKFIVNATPSAKMNLIMDPEGGDKIEARGSGQITLNYNSKDEALSLHGGYTIDEGKYNFTLQDIIIKSFLINKEGKITFNGDPYNANLDLTAIYSLKANLQDLDESFLTDPDMPNNVPVNVHLNVNGNISEPKIGFEIKFPSNGGNTAISDNIQTKFNSIISTDEMRMQQVLYLLALNRFYTPEYITKSEDKGSSELFSVASSTLSSQLSNMLGKINENWTISPNLRSNHGTFNEMEVDVALSSSLLNNRLKFNGNFGYRDKSLNTNQFIGDFDIEYLLNKRGSWRLKAYNRYNDQNYYLKASTTTQGVGLMYRQEFDNFLSFLNPLKKKYKKLLLQQPDSVKTEKAQPIDSISTK